MKLLAALLAAAAWMVTAHAAAQDGMARPPEPSRKMPADTGVRMPQPRLENTPTDPGVVVTPPRTGTEEIVKTPNKAIDPKIDDATSDIDRRNRKKSEQKSAR